jgi:hypothetical protein
VIHKILPAQQYNGTPPGHMESYTPNTKRTATNDMVNTYNGEPTPTELKHIYPATGSEGPTDKQACAFFYKYFRLIEQLNELQTVSFASMMRMSGITGKHMSWLW